MKSKSFPLLLILFFLISCDKGKVDPPVPVFPIPSERQLAWHEMEYYAFIHFSINTFTGREWGMGDEEPALFNPTELDTRQWARIVRDAGMKGIIITAKHHDGFCLWPSAYTEHSVKNSPWKEGNGDVIRELADACREFGIKMGIYYSPWDCNHPDYGKPEYLTYMHAQLSELLTQYGDLFEVWFDGANGGRGYYGGAYEERRVDKRKYYDWSETIGLVREWQPHAVIFSDAGPDVRWVGNEKGYAYETTWSPMMRDSVYPGMEEYAEKYAAGQEDGTHWVPAEADVSIRPGWYYHAEEDDQVKSLEQLADIYYHSIGRNSALLINFPVDRRGLIHEKDKEQILRLADRIKEDFSDNLALQAEVTAGNERGRGFEALRVIDWDPKTYWATSDEVTTSEITFRFPQPVWVNCFEVREYIPLGQRVRSFMLEAETDEGWREIYTGTTIGARRIIRFADTEVQQLRLSITDSRGCPAISHVGVYSVGE
ncbi:MAG TPA: alpha-L-fucosidase [Saprospiraceae bacterium]|nr:alpha-L-fucosidase [Saprospiraceae bacterium]